MSATWIFGCRCCDTDKSISHIDHCLHLSFVCPLVGTEPARYKSADITPVSAGFPSGDAHGSVCVFPPAVEPNRRGYVIQRHYAGLLPASSGGCTLSGSCFPSRWSELNRRGYKSATLYHYPPKQRRDFSIFGKMMPLIPENARRCAI